MLRLTLDRSGENAGFALSDDSIMLCGKTWEGGYMRSPAWFADLSDELDNCGCGLEDVEEFVCAIGPGSFSGIRSALAALEGMALPGRRPVRGISSAAALAYEYGLDNSGPVTVVGDARRSRLWIASFRFHEKKGLTLLDGSDLTQSAADFELFTAEEAAAMIPDETLVVSPDFDRIGRLLEDTVPSGRLVTEKVSSRAAVIAALCSLFPDLSHPEPIPVYLHPAVSRRT